LSIRSADRLKPCQPDPTKKETIRVLRAEILARLREPTAWDVIVIGGGATGLGAAVDAASRGYTTVLVEAIDFAKGTSSRATKLAHGGVRYLAQGNISLVRDALHERGLMRRNAPHLVHTLGFVIPAFEWWSMPFYGFGMKVYELLSGKLSLAASRTLSKDEATRLLPTIRQDGLLGGVLYFDAQFDDSRLAVTLARTLEDLGGVAANHAPVVGLLKHNGRVSGVQVKDSETGEIIELQGRTVINATGVFVDAVRQLDDPQAPKMLSPSQGAHVIVDREFIPGNSALMIPRTDDGRVLFGVPWHDKVILGTTDNAVPDASLEPRPMDQEVDFILRTAGRYLSKKPEVSDIRAMYAGLRPLVKAEGAGSTAALSRDHAIRVSSSGLITITGGKWTTYRKMGADVIGKAIEVAGLKAADSMTEGLNLHGYSLETSSEPWQVYGSDANTVQALPGANIKLHERLPYTEAQVRYAARAEMARTVEDVLSRRTRALLLDAAASLECAPRVAAILAEELALSESTVQSQLESYRQTGAVYLPQ
jgi:glycerol-3-phosphate dehydrogenase